jgi:hypothetical protein
MHPVQLANLLGPVAVRDLVGGSAGVVVCTAAVISGCAFASGVNLAWFAFFGILGAVSLINTLPTLRDVLRRPSAIRIVDVDEDRLQEAA